MAHNRISNEHVQPAHAHADLPDLPGAQQPCGGPGAGGTVAQAAPVELQRLFPGHRAVVVWETALVLRVIPKPEDGEEQQRHKADGDHVEVAGEAERLPRPVNERQDGGGADQRAHGSPPQGQALFGGKPVVQRGIPDDHDRAGGGDQKQDRYKVHGLGGHPRP